MPILSNLHNSPRKRREKKEDELASKWTVTVYWGRSWSKMFNLDTSWIQSRGMQSTVCIVQALMNLESLTNMINVMWTSTYLKRKQWYRTWLWMRMGWKPVLRSPATSGFQLIQLQTLETPFKMYTIFIILQKWKKKKKTIGELKQRHGQNQPSPSAPWPGSTNFPPSIHTLAQCLAFSSASHLCRRMITTVLLLQRLQSRCKPVSNSKGRKKSAWRPLWSESLLPKYRASCEDHTWEPWASDALPSFSGGSPQSSTYYLHWRA